MYGKGGMEVWGTLRKHMLKNDPGLAGVGIAKALNKQTNKQGQNPKFKKSRFVYDRALCRPFLIRIIRSYELFRNFWRTFSKNLGNFFKILEKFFKILENFFKILGNFFKN